MMNAVQHLLTILISVNCVFGEGISSADVVTIKEGSTATFSCSEQVNESIGYIAWAVTVNNGPREAIATSYSPDENNPECNTTVFKGVSNCTAFISFNEHAFTGQLTLMNVTSDAMHALIECIKKDESDKDSDEIWIMNAYRLNLYHLSSDVKCSSSLELNRAINVSCELPEVYPEIICRIFPELHRNLTTLGSQSQVTKLPELTNVTHFKKRLDRNRNYYKASCISEYYPTEPGKYQFHVVVYIINDRVKPVANITTKSLEIDIRVSYKPSNLESSPDLSETHKAFYTLIGSILILGVSVFLIISWVIWTKRCRCVSAPSATTQSNEYESVNYNLETSVNQTGFTVGSSDEGYGASTSGDVVVSDSEADEETLPQKLLEERGYILDVTVPKAHAVGRKENAYIVPVTPTSTLSRSFEERRYLDLPDNDDNHSETQSKECI